MTNAYLIRIGNQIINMNAIVYVGKRDNGAVDIYTSESSDNSYQFTSAEAEQFWSYLCSLTIKDIEVKTK